MTADNGARLAAILPTGIAAVGKSQGLSLDDRLPQVASELIPPVRAFVLVVVDGLGHANLSARAGHAPTLTGLQRRRIETVAPSTTGAALTTLLTGVLPGKHGLVGYRIRHPQLGLVTTLRDWAGIEDVSAWQLATPLLASAGASGARAIAVGRPAHEHGGLTEAILRGAEYAPGARIADRFAEVSRLVRQPEPQVVYLYVDELDRAAHEHGWQSAEWTRWLETFDATLADFLRTLPGDVGVAITADHGIVDVSADRHVMLDRDPELFSPVAEVGGEPRFRSLYLRQPSDAPEVAALWAAAEGKRAWVATREEAIAAGIFGPVPDEVAARLGDVLVAARSGVAYYSDADDPKSMAMVGQHGSFTEEERGVPLALAGALSGSGFIAAVGHVASSN